MREFAGAFVHMARQCPADVGRALIGLAGCCYGSAEYGPAGCECWEPVYDLDQQPLRPDVAMVRVDMCADCAYRPDSPERSGAQALAIRADPRTYEQIARDYPISATTVGVIKRGEQWSWLTTEEKS